MWGLKYIINYPSSEALICPFCHFFRIALPYLGGYCFDLSRPPFNEEPAINDSSCWDHQQTALRDASAVKSYLPQGHSSSWGSPHPVTD